MSAPRGLRSDAIVLRVIAFAETSQIVHLATPHHGIVSGIAKGAHAPKGSFQGGLSLGLLGEVEWVNRPRTDLALLRSFRVKDGLRGLREDLDRIAAATYVLGLLRDLERPALPAPALFLAGVTALKAIATSAPAQAPLWVAVFEARALAACGHRPELSRCVVCGADAETDLVFAPASGGLAHRRCATVGPVRPLGSAALAALRRLYTVRLPELVAEPPQLADLRAVRAVHDLFLPYVLEREPMGLRTLPRP